MNATHAFTDARPVARHCAALLRSGPGPAELLPAFANAAERVASALKQGLLPLLGGAMPSIRVNEPAETDSMTLITQITPLAGNSLLASGAQGSPVLVSVEPGAVFALVDRAFGGSGDLPSPLPAEFPLSAQLMATRIEQAVIAALGTALGAEGDAIRAVRRDGSLALLAPFAPGTRLARADLVVEEAARLPWTLSIVLPMATLASLFGHGDRVPAARPASGCADPFAAPFADVRLPLRAVMAEVDLPVSLVAALQVGQMLPIPVARVVPLRVGGRTIARGTVGAVDDRVAVQITRLS